MKQRKKILNLFPYFVVVGGVLLILAILYRGSNLFLPLNYEGGDELGVFYIIKTIRDHGWYLFNPQVGGITGGEMHDYMYCDSLSFLVVKIISLFIHNVYAIGNIFYFLSFVLVALVSVYVCKKLGYRDSVAILIGILYSFSPYMQMRYNHMWLTPYYLLPLAVLVSIWIIRGEIIGDKKKLILSNLFSFLLAFTGFYYAFFACVIYAIAIVIRIVNVKFKEIKKEIYVLSLYGAIVLGVIINVIPNIVYWLQRGMNPNSELNIRGPEGAEVYGLKLIQMILPRSGHRVWLFNLLHMKYDAVFPLVNENTTATLGVIATLGLVLSLIWLFQNKRKDKTYSYLNLSLFLVGTIGGIGAIFSLLIPTPMRCYNRISLLIMFVSLLCIAELLNNIKICKPKMKWLWGIGIVMIAFVGVYDQTIVYQANPHQQQKLAMTQEFVKEIEKKVDKEALIFQLPYVDWPSGGNYRMFAGYLESDTLRWSFGSMQGREEAIWQMQTATPEFGVEKMITELSENGYNGIYLDKVVYVNKYGEEATNQLCEELTENLAFEPIISGDEELYFWKIKN